MRNKLFQKILDETPPEVKEWVDTYVRDLMARENRQRVKVLKYGDTSTYEYDLKEKDWEWFRENTNRTKGQTVWLLQLVHGDVRYLKELEVQLANCLVAWVPSSFEDVERVMKMKPVCEIMKPLS